MQTPARHTLLVSTASFWMAAAGVAQSVPQATTPRGGDEFIAGQVLAAVAPDATIARIQASSADERATLIKLVNARLDAARRARVQLRQKSQGLDGAAKEAFAEAWGQAQRREKDVRRSLKELDRADAAKWAETCAELAANYDAYATATGQAEVLATQTAAPTPAGLSQNGAADAGGPAASDHLPGG